MKRGDIIELIEDTTFYKKGKKAYFIGRSKSTFKTTPISITYAKFVMLYFRNSLVHEVLFQNILQMPNYNLYHLHP